MPHGCISFEVSDAGALVAGAAHVHYVPASNTGPGSPARHPGLAREPGPQPSRCHNAPVITVSMPTLRRFRPGVTAARPPHPGTPGTPVTRATVATAGTCARPGPLTEVQGASGERDQQYEDRAPARKAARGESHGSGGAHVGTPKTDPTLQHPRCVFQILKRHYSRYTPEMVEQICGVPQDTFQRVCELVTENSGRDRTTAFAYSVGWTQHTVGVQYIRGAAILQSLLGNMGRPGGGILALRGHASIQGSTDIPTLYNLLPGYIPMPHAHSNEDLDAFVEAEGTDKGYWAEMRSYLVSLLKAWWGPAATPENDFCFDYLPRLTGSHSTYETVLAQLAGDCKGYFVLGENPAVGSANAKMQRMGMANLDWLVVRDFSLIESATFWQDGPEIETGELKTEDIKTEVFFMPAAAHTEKSGSFTNTQRLLQWHHQAVEPAGDARSELWFAYHLGRLIREKLAGSTDAMDRPLLDLTWDYPTEGKTAGPDAEAVLAEINGWDAEGNPVASYEQLNEDGSTACGCWIYCGVYADGVNQASRRKPGKEQNWVAPEWGWAWPANRRIIYNRASADPEGKPWSERKALVWWDEEKAKWTGHDIPDFAADKSPHYRPPDGATGAEALSGIDPFVMQADGKAWLYVPAALTDGPLRAAGLPVPQPAVRPAAEPGPAGDAVRPPGQPVPAQRRRGRGGRLPVRGDHLPADRAPHGRGHEPLAAVPGRAPAGVLLRGVPRASEGTRPGAPRLGHDRLGPQRHRGPGAGHRAADPADHPGRAPAPGRHPVPLGAERLQPGRRRQRPDLDEPGSELPHPGGQGVRLRHQARAPAGRPGPRRAGARVPAAGRHHRADGNRTMSTQAADPFAMYGYENRPP